MTLFDEHVANLNKAFMAIKHWPYQKERNQVLASLIKVTATELGLEIVVDVKAESKEAKCPIST